MSDLNVDEPKNETNGQRLLTVFNNHDADEQITLTLPDDNKRHATDDDDDDDDDVKFGWGPFKPRWLQVFRSKQMFLVVFCLAWVVQGMFYTYFVSVITTIEKLFQIQSKTTGVIMSATEIGQIGSSLLLTYYGGHGHRPRWIGCGIVLFALASLVCALPHFLYGETLLHTNELLFSGVTVNSSSSMPSDICRIDPFHGMSNYTETDYAWNSKERCENQFYSEHQQHSKITKIVLTMFFVSLLGIGMGQTAVYTLGIPYIDDNVTGRESPLYFAITIGVRILGPAFGFMLGSVCTRLYADLSVETTLSQTDPRWIGAWWLGLLLVSGLLTISAIGMFAFPKTLKKVKKNAVKSEGNGTANKTVAAPKIRDFPKTVKRLLKNDILMFRTASSVLHILPIAGIYTFLPKYLESQFRLPAHAANMITGLYGILVMGVGIIISGFLILQKKPIPRTVAGWIACTALLYSLGMFLLMFIGCPMDDFAGLHNNDNVGAMDFEAVCKNDCVCDHQKFNPVCGADNLTYYSACHAGCTNVTVSDNNVIRYDACACVPGNVTIGVGGSARTGFCDLNCNNFIWYIVVFSTFVFIHSTSEVGSILLILRCVDKADKSMALGLIQFAMGLFGNVPCPIIYGAVVDSACIVWEMACGEKGACYLYDSDYFRRFYHGTTGAIMLCAFVVDIIVWYKADSIQFDETADAEHAQPSELQELNQIIDHNRDLNETTDAR